ncbi:MAG TPA: hypothetical protein VGJ73_08660 [Verrucomicrobiae bacterium]
MICPIAALMLALVVHPGLAQNIPAEAAGDFKWFGGLGFPDVARSPYVRVATGQWGQSDGEAPQNRYIDGFLLITNGPSFTVLTIDVANETFTNTLNGTDEYKRVGYEILDLKQSADDFIQSLRRPPRPEELPGFYYRFSRAEVFVLGWACWRHGLDVQGAELYHQAQKLPSGPSPNDCFDSFRVSVEKDLACDVIWNATECLGDPSISRPQLLAIFNSVVTNFPDSEYHESALETAAILRKMIAEDRAHAIAAQTNLDQLPAQARVRELIYQLRDQNWDGVQANTTVGELVMMGYAAVPQLIEALDDPTLTRSVARCSPIDLSHYVLTVGTCAVVILQRITGTFFVPAHTSNDMSQHEIDTQTKRAAEAWWARCQKEGEKQMLIDALRAPDDNAPDQAEILCRKYPDVAVQTLERAIRAATNDPVRAELVDKFEFIEDPRVANFLNNEMINFPGLMSRVEAASQLLRLKKGDPVAAMIREWQGLNRRGFGPGDDDSVYVLDFLANANSPLAIKALGSKIQQCPVDVRLHIIDAIDQQGATNSAATWAAIEELLVEELGDTDDRMGMSGAIGNRSFSDPRVCDMAGDSLARLWTNRYAFDFFASLKIRDCQRIECINVWRQAHGEPLLSLPPECSTHVKPADATMVTDIECEDGGVKPSDEFTHSIAAFKGKHLDAPQIIGLLTHYVVMPEPQTSGLQFRAIKDDDLTGVRLLIRLLPTRQLTNSDDYNVGDDVTLGRKCLFSSGEGSGAYFGMTSAWGDFANAVNQALAGRSEVPFEIGVRIPNNFARPLQ